MKWASEDVMVQVTKNTYEYVNRYIDTTLPKEHIGHVVDRIKINTRKKEVPENTQLNPEIINTIQGY